MAQASADRGAPEDMQTGISEGEDVQIQQVEVAKWALRQAANRLKGVDEDAASLDGVVLPGSPSPEQRQPFTVFFGWEHPTDPQEYMAKGKGPSEGWPSWWVFPEWKSFSAMYSMLMAQFDQGKLGHVRPKPATFATSSWALYEMLQGLWLTSEERASFGKGPTNHRQRVQETPLWAKWAPGLKWSPGRDLQ